MAALVYRDIEIRGRVYPDANAAAAALGVTADAVRMAARRGTLHRCGTGASHPEPMPVRIRGVVYPDARTAAAALGVTPTAVWAALAAGNPDRVGLPNPPPNWRARPFTVGGLRFASMRAAALALGFSDPGYVARAMKRNSRRGRERILAAAMAYRARLEREAA